MSLATKLGRDDMVEKGNKILNKAVIVYAAAIIIGLVADILSKSQTVVTIAGILLLVAGIIDILVYVTYFMYLGKAVTMLEK